MYGKDLIISNDEDKNYLVTGKDYLDNNISDNDFKNSVIILNYGTKSQIDGSSLDTKKIGIYHLIIDYKNIIIIERKNDDDYLKETNNSLLQIVLNKIVLIKHFWVFDIIISRHIIYLQLL